MQAIRKRHVGGKVDERICRIRNARGMPNPQGHPSRDDSQQLCGAGVNCTENGITTLVRILFLDCASGGVICMNPIVRAVSSCIDQSDGRDGFPKLGISRLINVSRERRSLLCPKQRHGQ